MRAVTISCLAIGVLAAAAAGTTRSYAAAPEYAEPPFFSGETTFGQATVFPARDDLTGNTVFLMTPDGASGQPPPAAQDVIYAVVYPLSSTIPPGEVDCQTGAATGVGNCSHLQVLPFYNPVYDSNPADAAGTSTACGHFNGGRPCTVYLGHDHLVGVPSTGGAFNVAWHVEQVFFKLQAFGDGAINSRITTLAQLDALIASGDVRLAPTPVVFNCQTVPQTVYNQGVPTTFSFP